MVRSDRILDPTDLVDQSGLRRLLGRVNLSCSQPVKSRRILLELGPAMLHDVLEAGEALPYQTLENLAFLRSIGFMKLPMPLSGWLAMESDLMPTFSISPVAS